MLPALAQAGGAAAASPAASVRPTQAAGRSFSARLEAHRRTPAPPVPATPPSPAAATIQAVEAAQRRLDAILAAARSGRTFTAGELLALQGEAYRFTQTLDVAAKLVEQGVQGVKQAIQTPL
jgi:hypothetical protein